MRVARAKQSRDIINFMHYSMGENRDRFCCSPGPHIKQLTMFSIKVVEVVFPSNSLQG